MKKIKMFLSVMILMFIISSCKKEIPYGHPTCDTCDWNVLTCKVDGVPWQAKVDCDFLGNCDPVDCQYYQENGFLEIVGVLNNPKGSVLIDNYGKKLIIGDNLISPREFNYSCSGCSPEIPRSKLDTSLLNILKIIRIDTITKVIEGSFIMNLRNNAPSVVKITDGYFKLTYRP
ncbi:MAG TPA: hypothetical protein PK006_13565 [Saprospiraceae bacterium]|nr:hypothetical protein [Saprospiraceae bacterium]